MKNLILILSLIFVTGLSHAQYDDPSDSTTNYKLKIWDQGANPGADALNQTTITIDSVLGVNSSKINALKATTINGKSLSSNVVLTKSDLGIDTTNYLALANATGTLSDARLSSNVVLKNGSNAFTGTNTFQDEVFYEGDVLFNAGLEAADIVAANVDVSGQFTINGSPINNGTNASALTSGTLADARLSANVPLLDAKNTFSDDLTVNGGTTLTEALKSEPVNVTGVTVDWKLSNTFYKTLTVDPTFLFDNAVTGQVITLVLNNSTYVPNWGSVTGLRWSGGVPPTPTTNKTDVYTFVKIGSTIYGAVIQNFTP